jgi:type I restriction enzyme S subunit
MIKLGDVISLDKTIKVDIQDNVEYTIAGVQSYGKGVLNKRKELGINMTMKQYQLIEPNQLMWCKVDTKNGAFGITKSEHKGSLASTNMCLAKIKTDKILPEFLEKLFRIKFFHENITHLSSGTTNRKYLTPNQLCDLIYIPNFTIQEQKDFLLFVNKLESSPIFSHIDFQLTQLENLNQAILQEAVQGKLVKQDPTDEPASELLKRIKAEKAKSGKKEKPLPPIQPEEIPFEIPEYWVWCRLGEIIEYTDNLDIQKHLSPNTIINYVDIDAIDNHNFVIREAKQKTVSELSTRARRILKPNYIVYSTVRPYLKNIAIVEDEKDNYIGSTGFNVFRTLNVELKYVFYYLLTPFVNNSFKDLMVGFNSPSITNDQFEKSLFPLPPLSEQKHIVAEIEKQFAKTKQLKEHIIANQQATEQLLKALLHQAFEVKEMETL